MKKLIIYLLFVFCISNICAFPILVRPLSSGSVMPSQTFNYEFNFTTDYSCSNVVLSLSSLITTDQYGTGFVEIDISNHTEIPSFLCEYRDGSLRKVHNMTSMFFKDIFANSITVKGDGNFSGTVYVNNDTDVALWTYGKILGFTTSNFDGNLSLGSDIGYVAGNNICASNYSGSHFCLKSEILKTIANGNYSFTGTAWFQNGPPGYTANADDCAGWTTNLNTFLGPFWNWDGNAQAGYARLTNCQQSKPLLCCR